jgi:hypothetical protein
VVPGGVHSHMSSGRGRRQRGHLHPQMLELQPIPWLQLWIL